MSNVDANSRSLAMGVTNDAAQTATPLRVDPITGRLLIAVAGGTSGGVAPTRDTVDANSRQVDLAVTSDTGALRPLATTTEGYLLIDIV